MALTYGQALQRVAERTVDNRDDIKRKNLQRRTNFTHSYGSPYWVRSDGSSPARVYISIPPDLDRWMRYEFKIVLEKTTASDFRITLRGGGASKDITAYLMAQQDGAWISGEGVYPSTALDEDGNYDILQVISDLEAEEYGDAQKFISPGLKIIEISSFSAFEATMLMYVNYSHVNR